MKKQNTTKASKTAGQAAAELEAKKLADARATLDAKDKSDCDACAKEIEAACNKWGCSMIARGQFAGNEIQTGISIIKKK